MLINGIEIRDTEDFDNTAVEFLAGRFTHDDDDFAVLIEHDPGPEKPWSAKNFGFIPLAISHDNERHPDIEVGGYFHGNCSPINPLFDKDFNIDKAAQIREIFERYLAQVTDFDPIDQLIRGDLQSCNNEGQVEQVCESFLAALDNIRSQKDKLLAIADLWRLQGVEAAVYDLNSQGDCVTVLLVAHPSWIEHTGQEQEVDFSYYFNETSGYLRGDVAQLTLFKIDDSVSRQCPNRVVLNGRSGMVPESGGSVFKWSSWKKTLTEIFEESGIPNIDSNPDALDPKF
jgi:hypothetical protein